MSNDNGDIARLIVGPALDALVGALFDYDPQRAAYVPKHAVFTDTEVVAAKRLAQFGSYVR